VATRKFFMERLQEEVQRAKDFGAQLTLVMLSVDGINEQLNRLGRKGSTSFCKTSDGWSRPRSATMTSSAVLISTVLPCCSSTRPRTKRISGQKKVRRNIASNVINLEDKSFSVTVSVGVCGGVEEASDVELMENANKVLSKAIEAGGKHGTGVLDRTFRNNFRN